MRRLALLLLLGTFALLEPLSAGASKDVEADRITTVGSVELIPVPPSSQFPEASEEGILNFACSSNSALLQLFFSERDLPFEPDLIRRVKSKECHVFYSPTLQGFRADTDDLPVQEIFFDVHTSSFLARRPAGLGDPLDISREILPKLDRSMTVNLGMTMEIDQEHYERAVPAHFPESIHNFRLRHNESEASNPWAQDYLKSGRVGGFPAILVTRRLYEGRADFGDQFARTLDSFRGDRFFRSNLSWEGGDLQFVRNPENPKETILLFGSTAKKYWGEELTDEEYAYILQLEFGADYAVDLSGLASHVDYFVSLNPDSQLILVAEPLEEDLLLARDAALLLRDTYTGLVDASPLEQLVASLQIPEDQFRNHRKEIRSALRRAKNAFRKAVVREDMALAARIQKFIAEHCATDPARCLAGDTLVHLLDTDADLLQRWSTAALEAQDLERLAPCLLAIIESQLPGYPDENTELRESKIQQLQRLGFQTVSVPAVAGQERFGVAWAGLSYVNSLVVGRKIFVPTIGLEHSERRILDQLQRKLPEGLEVVPIYARHTILNNGGIHCVSAVVRGFNWVEISKQSTGPRRLSKQPAGQAVPDPSLSDFDYGSSGAVNASGRLDAD